jgi:hypothetical protein
MTKDDSVKKEVGKIRMSLIPPSLMIEVGKCITFGADKYSDYGWKDVDDSLYKDALLRHLTAWLENRDSVDSETGYSHLSHAACNIAILIEKQRIDRLHESEWSF